MSDPSGNHHQLLHPQDETKKCERGSAKREDRDRDRDRDRQLQSDDDIVVDERQKNGKTLSDLLSTHDHDLEHSGKKKPLLIRSKTFDHSLLTQVQTDSASKIERKKSHYSQLSKSNCQYHKIFKEISKEEQLRQSYTCALQKDILYQGRMFVSDHWIGFHSNVFGKDIKIAIPALAVTNIKKTKTAILLPNALVISTEHDRHVFVSFLSRDNTYKLLMSVCLHLDEKSPCSSPIPSSGNSFRGVRSSMAPLFPLREFRALDGSLRQRRQELDDSSSSDSQAADYEKISEFPVPSFLQVLKHQENPSPEQTKHQHTVKNQQNSEKQHSMLHAEVVIRGRTHRSISLNTLLCVYMFLVCVLVFSSCYLAFQIVSLEKRLTSLGSGADSSHYETVLLRSRADVNTDVLTELLTINIKKLEKVQRNLQRLLEEAP